MLAWVGSLKRRLVGRPGDGGVGMAVPGRLSEMGDWGGASFSWREEVNSTCSAKARSSMMAGMRLGARLKIGRRGGDPEQLLPVWRGCWEGWE